MFEKYICQIFLRVETYLFWGGVMARTYGIVPIVEFSIEQNDRIQEIHVGKREIPWKRS